MFTVLTPYRKREGQFNRLTRLLEVVRRMPLVNEMIVSEYGLPDPDLDRLGISVVREHTEAIWNRSRCLNTGLGHCRSRCVLVLDADCVPDSRLTLKLEELHGEWPAVILHVTRQGWLVHGAGNLSVELDLIRSIGGWDEAYEGYGREDKDLELRLQPRVAYLDSMVTDDHSSWPLAAEIEAAWERNKAYFARKHSPRPAGW